MTTTKKRLDLHKASGIQIKATRWLWDKRVPLGALTLLAGAEGIGKSSLTYNLIAQITTGTLDGHYQGQPKSVFITASEDSWEHTIVPRLMATGADLSKVFKVEVEEFGGGTDHVHFPDDVEELGRGARANDVALIVLDPLMSRIGGGLDTHKDSEVRQALEPLVKMANDSGAAVLGIIHINKRNSNDALNNIMGSRAFTAVSRAVLYVQEDPEDRATKYVNQAKSNLGPTTGLADLAFQIQSKDLGEYQGDDPNYQGEHIFSSYLTWTGEEFGAAMNALNHKPARTYARDGRPARIVELVKEQPGISKNMIWKTIGGNRPEVLAEINELLDSSELVLFGTFKIGPAEEIDELVE